MTETVAEIETRRLLALQAQAAQFGPHTDPAVLIEIQDLTRRNRGNTFVERRQLVNNLDYDFLMNVVAAALVRLGEVESNQLVDKKSRWLRQLIHDFWMVIITTMVFVLLIMSFYS